MFGWNVTEWLKSLLLFKDDDDDEDDDANDDDDDDDDDDEDDDDDDDDDDKDDDGWEKNVVWLASVGTNVSFPEREKQLSMLCTVNTQMSSGISTYLSEKTVVTKLMQHRKNN